MTPDEIKSQVSKIRWFHTIDLGNGVVTPGRDNTPEKLKTLNFPEKLDGWSVLDIGAYDGFFSFEAEKRGAKRVLAVDSSLWGSGDTNAGFNLARKVLNSKVEDKMLEVLEISPETVGTFDLVLFLGILYHMRHPLLSLEKMYSVTQKLLIVETAVDMLGCNRPALAFYPGEELNKDASNWFGPNPQAVEAMLKTVGFSKVEMIACYTSTSRNAVLSNNSSLSRTLRAGYHKIKNGIPFSPTFNQGRAVFHAWK